jgi:ADP-ribose pyrophosphatase YjhB (NUDIX family)
VEATAINMMTKPIQDKRAAEAHWPRLGASFALFRETSVLLVERAKPPRAGLWSLPGGHVEPGETAAAAALRELHEETGLRATSSGLVDVLDVIVREPDGALQAHYLLAVYCGRWEAGEPQPSSDARSTRFVSLDRLDELPLTPEAKRLISQAWTKLHSPA